LRRQKFGIEIEMTGMTREMAARVIAGHFSAAASHIGGFYDVYSVNDHSGRAWKIMRDVSIHGQTGRMASAGSNYAVEVVSPVCRYEDIGTIQETVRILRRSGAKVNSSCGIHIHIDASPHSPKTLKNIVNIVASKEDILYKALKIHVSREHYCKKTDTRFLGELNRRRPMSMDGVGRALYGESGRGEGRYDSRRYHGLNLNSVFVKGTIEFRLFNSTLHAGEIKSYIQLCLAISHQALTQKRASHSKTISENEKYTFRTWLLRLGMIGDEFKSARLHLLKNLEGNIAWKHPGQAEMQKQRLQENRQGGREESPEGQDRFRPDGTAAGTVRHGSAENNADAPDSPGAAGCPDEECEDAMSISM
jgi:hypothetical protein